MRIGLISDTHDRVPAVAALLQKMVEAGITMVLHAGDYCSPFVLAPFEEMHVSLAGVYGRNDGDRQGLLSRAQGAFGTELFESPHSFEMSERRILLVHDIGEVQQRSIEGHDIVVHGATHQQEIKHRGDTLIVNPGEACGWLYGRPSAAILDLAARKVEMINLDAADWQR